jgi:hypothetical protein
MRVNACCVTIAAISAFLASGTIARAQGSPPCTFGVTSFASSGVPSKTDAPYSATLKTSFEQKLPDGNAIRGFNVTHQSRDSKGRTMNEMATGCTRGEDGQPKERMAVNVFDPTTNTMMNWQVDDLIPKIVHVFHMQIPDCKQPTADEAAEQKKRLQTAAKTQRHDETRFENLGSKTVDGVLVEGMRTVRTIPVGEEGNDLPLEVINEQWTSKELGLTLIRIDDDPRRGRTTIEFEALSFGEPDPAVFAAPSGYKIVEQHPEVETAAAK